MRISDWSSYVCSSDLVGSVVEANQWNLVETAAQGGFLSAQELVEPQHPIVWLGFEKILGQTRNQRCWRHLGDAQFQHQIVANLRLPVRGDVASQPRRGLGAEQYLDLLRAEEFTQFLRAG